MELLRGHVSNKTHVASLWGASGALLPCLFRAFVDKQSASNNDDMKNQVSDIVLYIKLLVEGHLLGHLSDIRLPTFAKEDVPNAIQCIAIQFNPINPMQSNSIQSKPIQSNPLNPINPGGSNRQSSSFSVPLTLMLSLTPIYALLWKPPPPPIHL